RYILLRCSTRGLMPGRVKISRAFSEGIRVSLPGYEVETATWDQIAFVGNAGAMTLFLRGVATAALASIGGGVVHGEVVVPFPTTAPRVPVCFYWSADTTTGSAPTAGTGPFGSTQPGSTWSGTYAY